MVVYVPTLDSGIISLKASKRKMSSKVLKAENTCAVRGCKVTIFNKGESISFHTFPNHPDFKQRWISILKDKCINLSHKSRICSKHFERRYFDFNKKLTANAIPTIFPSLALGIPGDKKKLDRLLSRLTQQQLVEDINDTISLVKVPDNFSDCVTDDLKCVPNTPVEAQLWLLIRKQDHLISRLTQQLNQSKKNAEVLQKNMEECKASKTAMEQNIETLKYIVKSLQEKHATLEEQIEILTAVESR